MLEIFWLPPFLLLKNSPCSWQTFPKTWTVLQSIFFCKCGHFHCTSSSLFFYCLSSLPLHIQTGFRFFWLHLFLLLFSANLLKNMDCSQVFFSFASLKLVCYSSHSRSQERPCKASGRGVCVSWKSRSCPRTESVRGNNLCVC